LARYSDKDLLTTDGYGRGALHASGCAQRNPAPAIREFRKFTRIVLSGKTLQRDSGAHDNLLLQVQQKVVEVSRHETGVDSI
jgi:hypothetical protein